MRLIVARVLCRDSVPSFLVDAPHRIDGEYAVVGPALLDRNGWINRPSVTPLLTDGDIDDMRAEGFAVDVIDVTGEYVRRLTSAPTSYDIGPTLSLRAGISDPRATMPLRLVAVRFDDEKIQGDRVAFASHAWISDFEVSA